MSTRHFHPKSDLPSLTQQQFKDEVDINNIVNNLRKGIIPPHMAAHKPQYGDATSIEYVDALNKVAQINNVFERLPARLRAKFQNRPEMLMKWLEDPENAEKAKKMGLLVERQKPIDYEAIIDNKEPPKPDPEANPRHDRQDKNNQDGKKEGDKK